MARILICEDDELYRQIAAAAFVSSGHEILFLEDGVSVAMQLKSNHFDLLVTDLVMPGKDGLEVIKELRDDGCRLPILVMSGGVPSLRTPILAAATALGADEVITKPFRPQALQEKADAMLRQAALKTAARTD